MVLKFKLGSRVWYEYFDDKDFGKIVKIFPKTKQYLVRPEGAGFNLKLKEKFIKEVI